MDSARPRQPHSNIDGMRYRYATTTTHAIA
jgi:hypothetical protein